MRKIAIFDTTLRDGEQAPGCSMSIQNKINVAEQLERLGVDCIEAGFAISGSGDFQAVQAISRTIRDTAVASLARALPKDIDTAWEALKGAARPRIHLFLATSPIHMEYKLRKTPDEIYEQAVAMTAYARNLCGDIEFSCEDATRSDREFLYRIIEGVINAGAGTVNIPDTVGYANPEEMGSIITAIKKNVPNISKARISVHCHNDLGLAVANSLAAAMAGADQIECTVNGLGERAGNAALEEIVMNMTTRRAYYGLECGVDTTQIYASSRLVSKSSGVRCQPNKAVVGENAFAHEAGIHQHGIIANRATYEIMTPESVGIPSGTMVLGKHSGRHAFENRLYYLGYHFDEKKINVLFEDFKTLSDKKKTVTDRDIEALIASTHGIIPPTYQLDRFVINSGSSITSTSSVRLLHKDGLMIEKVAIGDGPIDASLNAIDKIVRLDTVLEDFSLATVDGGTDAQGEAHVRISREGRSYNAIGVSTDIVEAGIKAYLAAINTMIYETLESSHAENNRDI